MHRLQVFTILPRNHLLENSINYLFFLKEILEYFIKFLYLHNFTKFILLVKNKNFIIIFLEVKKFMVMILILFYFVQISLDVIKDDIVNKWDV